MELKLGLEGEFEKDSGKGDKVAEVKERDSLDEWAGQNLGGPLVVDPLM